MIVQRFQACDRFLGLDFKRLRLHRYDGVRGRVLYTLLEFGYETETDLASIPRQSENLSIHSAFRCAPGRGHHRSPAGTTGPY